MKTEFLMRITLLMLVAIIATGCIGGSSNSDEQKINDILDQYEQATKAKDAKLIASLATYPIYIANEYVTSETKAAERLAANFRFIDRFEQFEITDREISIQKNEAVATFTVKSATTSRFGPPSSEERQQTIRFRKVGKTWKITKF